jgi:hypothetical protein
VNRPRETQVHEDEQTVEVQRPLIQTGENWRISGLISHATNINRQHDYRQHENKTDFTKGRLSDENKILPSTTNSQKSFDSL